MRPSRVIVLTVCALIAGPPAVAQAASTQTFTTSQSEFTSGIRGAGEGGFGDNFICGSSGSMFGGTQQLLVTCLPERKEECKSGGWRNFGVFRNQGDCVSFVATGGPNQPAGPST
jgi:hypothetical protein